MTKWKRLKRGIYYLEGERYTAVVSKIRPDYWSYGVYKLFVPSELNYGVCLSRGSGGKAMAQMQACQALRMMEEGQPVRDERIVTRSDKWQRWSNF